MIIEEISEESIVFPPAQETLLYHTWCRMLIFYLKSAKCLFLYQLTQYQVYTHIPELNEPQMNGLLSCHHEENMLYYRKRQTRRIVSCPQIA